MFCLLLLCSKVTQLYTYIRSFSHITSHIIFHHVLSQVIGYSSLCQQDLIAYLCEIDILYSVLQILFGIKLFAN